MTIRRCLTSLTAAATLPFSAFAGITLQPLGTFETGVFDEGAQEIAAHDPKSQRLFVVNAEAATVDVLDIKNPANPTKLFSIDATPYGDSANSVAVHNGIVAVAVEADPKTDPGKVVFFDVKGNYLKDVTVGALPDMVTFTPNGLFVLVANEGEPNDDYTVDPEGSVSVISLLRGVKKLKQSDVRTADFKAFNNAVLDPSVRIFGPGATVAEDIEPEYITVSPTSLRAWVTLQENNAIAEIDILRARVTKITGLGFKDHNLPGNALDSSDDDGAIIITNRPVKGMYLPDGIASFVDNGRIHLITANEGDARDYDAFGEEERVKNLDLDPTAFPDADDLQKDEIIGRLNVTTTLGDTDNDGDYDELYAFGGRSFSIWTPRGDQVYDSGEEFEQITAAAFPDDFNADNAENGSFDSRSDNKGPEPEGIEIGYIGLRRYEFIGLERIGGIMIYDISNPAAPQFESYVNPRDFSGDAEAGTAGDLGPEGIVFIPWWQSPILRPLLVVANEVSGSTTIYQVVFQP